jgi:hypothetical protein
VGLGVKAIVLRPKERAPAAGLVWRIKKLLYLERRGELFPEVCIRLFLCEGDETCHKKLDNQYHYSK